MLRMHTSRIIHNVNMVAFHIEYVAKFDHDQLIPKDFDNISVTMSFKLMRLIVG